MTTPFGPDIRNHRTVTVAVKLTKDEVAVRGEELSANLAAQDQEDAKMAALRDEHKKSMSALTRVEAVLRRQIDTGEEEREVEAYDRYDWDTGTVDVVLASDGTTVIGQRPIPDEERQARLLDDMERQFAPGPEESVQ